MGYQSSDIPDLVRITKEEMGDMSYTDATLDEEELVTLPMFREQIETQVGGQNIEPWDIMVEPLANTRAITLDDIDQIDDNDQFVRAQEEWRHVTGGYPIHRKLLNMNRGSYKIVDYLQAKRFGALVNHAKQTERFFWTLLDADDNKTPRGLLFWCVKYVSGESDGGAINGGTATLNDGLGGDHLGGTPTGYSAPGGITHARYKNYANKYGEFDEDDGIKKLWYAVHRCNFKGVKPHPDPARRKRPRWEIFFKLETKRAAMDAARAQNDNIGWDLGRGTNEVTFLNIPMTWVPFLDYDNDDPIYGVDWAVLWPVALDGEWMTEDEIEMSPGYHLVARVHMDSTYGIKCTDRRRLFVLAKGATTNN